MFDEVGRGYGPLSIHDVMAGHSRPKDGVASLAYVPAIHVFFSTERKAWMPATSAGMTVFCMSAVARQLHV